MKHLAPVTVTASSMEGRSESCPCHRALSNRSEASLWCRVKFLFTALLLASTGFRCASGAPLSAGARARRVRQDGKISGSSLTCYSLIEQTHRVTTNKTVKMFSQCANNAGMSVQEKLRCNQIWTERIRELNLAGQKLNYRHIQFTYSETKLKTNLKRITRQPSFQRQLLGNFHWIEWNSTVPLVRNHPKATHIRCEWKFVLRNKHAALERPHDPSPGARLHLFNKIWVRRAPSEAGCSRNDGRLTITSQNTTGRKTTERERFCGRHHLPGEQIKQFWPETSTVVLSFRSSLNNSAVGPMGYFFIYRDSDVYNGCSMGCPHSARDPYKHCNNGTLPDFLKISVAESRSRKYTTEELINGFAIATRLRQKESPEYHCVDRYPIFKQMFRQGSLPNPHRRRGARRRQDLRTRETNEITSNSY